MEDLMYVMIVHNRDILFAVLSVCVWVVYLIDRELERRGADYWNH